ncbi:hypothetical protein VTK73DRAFT_9277 [Phialemonium thermophilum]|uniref:Uncharacterized protein n=1 Tax=Phialemonium thermophilum TaxID=223376 RepID=A0ABR3W3G2_9PEZI
MYTPLPPLQNRYNATTGLWLRFPWGVALGNSPLHPTLYQGTCKYVAAQEAIRSSKLQALHHRRRPPSVTKVKVGSWTRNSSTSSRATYPSFRTSSNTTHLRSFYISSRSCRILTLHPSRFPTLSIV